MPGEKAARSLRSRDSKSCARDEEGDSVEHAQADVNEEDDTATASAYIGRGGVKRKQGESQITIHNTPKKKRRVNSGDEDAFVHQDVYCWECHKECVESALDCCLCPRTYHINCVDDPIDNDNKNWNCPVCSSVARAESENTRSWATKLLSPDQLGVLLCFVLRRMRHQDSDPFQHPVPQTLVQDYYTIVFCPIDLATLEKKVRKGAYASTEGFVTDASWILHNSFIFNGPTNKYTNDAKLIMKICKHEISELELCPDCYRNSVIRQENWFSEPCTSPHCLVWAKLKGFPTWPAKCLRMSANNQMVDVRFFGEYDRSWIPIAQASLLTEVYPNPKKNLKKYGLDKAIEELHDHIDRLREKFGVFQYMNTKVDFKPEFLTNCPQFEGDPKTLRAQPHCRPMAAPSPSCSSIGASEGRDADMSSHYGRSMSPQPGLTGVFTSEQSLKGSLDNPDALDKGVMSACDEDNSFSCLDRINDCLQQEKQADNSLCIPPAPVIKVVTPPPPKIERKAKKTLSNRIKPSDSPKPICKPLITISKPVSTPPPAPEITIKPVNGQIEPAVVVHEVPVTPSPTPPVSDPPKSNGIQCNEIQPATVSSAEVSAKNGNVSEANEPVSVPNVTSPGEENQVQIASVFQKHAESVTSFLETTFGCMWHDLSNAMTKAVPQPTTAPAPVTNGPSVANHEHNDAEIMRLRQQVKKLQWMSQTALEEVEHTTKLALSDLRKRFEFDKGKLVTELMKKAETEKIKAVQEAKSKQWCACCGKEAVFYCCWNTSYCDYPCQQQHWPKHQHSCAQIRTAPQQGPGSSLSTNNSPPVFMLNSQQRRSGGTPPTNPNYMSNKPAIPPPNVSLMRRM